MRFLASMPLAAFPSAEHDRPSLANQRGLHGMILCHVTVDCITVVRIRYGDLLIDEDYVYDPVSHWVVSLLTTFSSSSVPWLVCSGFILGTRKNGERSTMIL